MTGTPRAFATFDFGGATTATALIGMVEGRWRLLGGLAGPVAAPADLLLGLLAQRVCTAAPDLAEAIWTGDLARARTTISREVATGLSRRLPRVYHAAAGLTGVRTLLSGAT